MKISLIVVGKTTEKYIEEAINEYVKRIGFFNAFNMMVIPDLKNAKSLSKEMIKQKEGESILSQIVDYDDVVLLDEKGKEFTSLEFASYIEKKMVNGVRKVAFVIGGPYGFSDDVYNAAKGKISLSKMTFSHQIIRPLFLEQLYRAYTIINNTPYHHE